MTAQEIVAGSYDAWRDRRGVLGESPLATDDWLPHLSVVLTSATVIGMSTDLTSSPQQPLPGPQANLGYLFRLAHQRFRAMLDDELQDIGLSAQEYGILSVFETRAELSTSELARVTQVTRQTMHPAILRLEAAGLLERRARNQRVVLLRPTKQGRDALRAATKRIRVAERAAFTGLSKQDEAAVRAWLSGLAAPAPAARRADADGKEKS
jgi:DNA-binding MarR family transcriptional regulator